MKKSRIEAIHKPFYAISSTKHWRNCRESLSYPKCPRPLSKKWWVWDTLEGVSVGVKKCLQTFKHHSRRYRRIIYTSSSNIWRRGRTWCRGYGAADQGAAAKARQTKVPRLRRGSLWCRGLTAATYGAAAVKAGCYSSYNTVIWWLFKVHVAAYQK